MLIGQTKLELNDIDIKRISVYKLLSLLVNTMHVTLCI